MNCHLGVYYLHKRLSAKRNYKIHNIQLLAIIEGFKTWRHYFKRAIYTILVFADQNNPKEYMEITCLSR